MSHGGFRGTPAPLHHARTRREPPTLIQDVGRPLAPAVLALDLRSSASGAILFQKPMGEDGSFRVRRL